jgi:diguanylate cyclase (GGDEF)-like protein/PAS domain S-box-containing protein
MAQEAHGGVRRRTVPGASRITSPSLAHLGLHAMLDQSSPRFLFDQIPVAISLNREVDGVYVDVNAEWTRLTGLSASDVVGRGSVEVGMWRSDAQRTQALQHLHDSGQLHDVSMSFVRPDGTSMLLSVNVSRIELDGVSYLLSYLKDVTQAQAMQDALLASEQLLKASNERQNRQLRLFEAMESIASVGYWTSSDAPDSLVWSKGLYKLAGMAPGTVTHTDAGRRLIHPDDQAHFAQARRALDGSLWEYRWLHPDGKPRWVRSRMKQLSEPGEPTVAFGVVQDITREREVTVALQDRLDFIQKITSRLPGAVFQMRRRPGGTVEFLFVSEPASQVYPGFTAADILRDPLCTLSLHHPDDIRAFKASIETALVSLQPWQFEYRLRLPDGEVRWLLGQGLPELDEEGGVLMSGFVTDVSERKLAEKQIEKLAFYDALTGLPNRRLLIERLHQALLTAGRHGNVSAVLFIDLDNFKDLNDSMGHDVGDLLLLQVAQRLQGSVRDTDTVARLGGDEFVVLLEELGADAASATAQAEQIGYKILSQLNQVYDLNKLEHHSTPSMGVALLSRGVKSVDELLKQADLAMYQSKAAGRNTLRFFDPAMQALVAQRTALDQDLRLALRRGEFVLFYQPVVDHAASVVGFEALVRWQHPQHGLLTPGEFIAQAEHTGLIVALGQWIMRAACEQLLRWAAQPETSALTIAVNVSSRQFRHPDFVKQVLKIVHSTGVDPRLLKLEITESLLVTDMTDVVEKMNALRAHQLVFSLDDFGTGYSSLSYLKRLPLSQLKIDQSFVCDVLTDPSDATIAKTVLALGGSLNMQVVAEGVEALGQWQFLLQNGCSLFQGYLFSRPVPVDQIPLGCLLPSAV